MRRETIVVCEIGINHSGSIDIAKQLIDLAKDTGCDYVKFQKRDIISTYTKEFLDSPRESPFGNTQRAQKNALEFNLEQYQEIDVYCKKMEIPFFISPWDLKSIDFLEQNFPNMPYLKIPSALITNQEYLDKCNETKFPIIISTGMSNLQMVQNAVMTCRNTTFVLGCTSAYPCPTRDLNLAQLRFLAHYFRTPNRNVGWSDHSGGILFPALSVAYGAKMVEVHITMDRRMYGSDQASSLEPQGLRKLVKYIEEIELGIGNPLKEIQESELSIIKKLRG